MMNQTTNLHFQNQGYQKWSNFNWNYTNRRTSVVWVIVLSTKIDIACSQMFWAVLGTNGEGCWLHNGDGDVRLDGWGAGRPRHKEGEWGEGSWLAITIWRLLFFRLANAVLPQTFQASIACNLWKIAIAQLTPEDLASMALPPSALLCFWYSWLGQCRPPCP